jgi:hypothetical protein
LKYGDRSKLVAVFVRHVSRHHEIPRDRRAGDIATMLLPCENLDLSTIPVHHFDGRSR